MRLSTIQAVGGFIRNAEAGRRVDGLTGWLVAYRDPAGQVELVQSVHTGHLHSHMDSGSLRDSLYL